MKNRTMAAVAVMVFLAGCASATKIVTPDGQAGYTINCSGPYMSIEQCLVKAGEQCPHGYKVLGASNEQTTFGLAESRATVNPWRGQANSGAYGQVSANRIIAIACKG